MNGLVPISFENLSVTLFGEDWIEPMSRALDVPEDELRRWLTDPTTIPADMEGAFEELCEARIGEIRMMIIMLKNARLSRSVEDNERGQL